MSIPNAPSRNANEGELEEAENDALAELLAVVQSQLKERHEGLPTTVFGNLCTRHPL